MCTAILVEQFLATKRRRAANSGDAPLLAEMRGAVLFFCAKRNFVGARRRARGKKDYKNVTPAHDLTARNAELHAEFTRLSESPVRDFYFPTWYAQQVRDATREVGRIEWARLTKAQQHERLVAYLRGLVGVGHVRPL
jgi:hypothetical protein